MSKGKRVRITNDSLNSYGTRVLTAGMNVEQYQRNPVLLYMHERGNVIGYVKDLKVENGEVTGELMFDEASELSIRCKKQYEFGSLKMVSAGLDILETSEDPELLVQGQTSPTVTKSKLFEVSLVDIGANDDAIVLQKDGKCRFVCAEDNYRKAITYFHDWYAEGLMDVEMFSQDTNQLLAKGAQGYLGVSTWWYIEELMGDYSKDYVFLPVLDGPDGTHNVTVRTGGGTNSGNLNVTNKCQSPANLLKFFDQWYDGETVMQLQYGPIGVFFTEQDANGKWKSITEEEAKAKYNKGAGELKSTYEVWGPKLILSEYYDKYFYMEDRAIERLTDLKDFWMPFVDDTTTYPIDCVFTSEELDTIDRYRADFENAVSEQEGLWLKDGGPSDDEWSAYLDTLTNSCGMDKLLEVYQNAYDRYKANV